MTQRRLLRAYRISRQQPYEAALMKHTTRSVDGACRARPAHPIAGKSFSSMVGYERAQKERPPFLRSRLLPWNVERRVQNDATAESEHTEMRVSRKFERTVVWLFSEENADGMCLT